MSHDRKGWSLMMREMQIIEYAVQQNDTVIYQHLDKNEKV